MVTRARKPAGRSEQPRSWEELLDWLRAEGFEVWMGSRHHYRVRDPKTGIVTTVGTSGERCALKNKVSELRHTFGIDVRRPAR